MSDDAHARSAARKPSAPSPRPKNGAGKPRRRRKMPKEYGGRDGPEPVRYGDWEKKGIAVDF